MQRANPTRVTIAAVATAATEPLQANADFTIPVHEQGLNVIPTPVFMYNNVSNAKNLGFSATFWGNTLGVDSNRQKVAANLLAPQISLVGLKLEFDKRLTNTTSAVGLALVLESNFLLKKVAYYDTTQKSLTSFNPFAVHPRIGFTTSFFQDNFFFGGYCNFLTIVTGNDQFTTFFNTGNKSVFVYPEFNVGSIFNISGTGNQFAKVEFDFIVNNGEVKFLYSSKDKLIPFIKIGIVTRL